MAAHLRHVPMRVDLSKRFRRAIRDAYQGCSLHTRWYEMSGFKSFRGACTLLRSDCATFVDTNAAAMHYEDVGQLGQDEPASG